MGSGNDYGVAALVVIVRGVKRLVQIAYEVQEELQRKEALSGTRPRRLQLGRKLVDLVDRAIIGRSVGCDRAPRKGRVRFALASRAGPATIAPLPETGR